MEIRNSGGRGVGRVFSGSVRGEEAAGVWDAGVGRSGRGGRWEPANWKLLRYYCELFLEYRFLSPVFCYFYF